MTTTNADGDDHTTFDSLSPVEMVWVNQWCDKFEEKWREGEPSLAEFVREISPSHSQPAFTALCLELIAIDMQNRQRLQFECSPEYYKTQFSELDQQDITRVAIEVAGTVSMDGSGPLRLNQQLGDYDVRELIGSGGMGAVYRAEHRLMRRQVAIKVLRGRSVYDLTLQRRFLREVRALGKLSHMNIIAAFDARLEGELLYLVTEWIQGEDLAQSIARTGPLTCPDALDHILQAARGLEYAHSQGIIHRDVKPSNLLLDQHGTVKVLDLGLSRLLLDENESPSEALTQSMHILGTVAYMSPEQSRSPLTSDRRSDVYSLGCTLYFLLTGKPPYSGSTALDVLFSHDRDPIPEVTDSNGSIDAETVRLLQSMLAKKPEDRPASMEEVSGRITQILDGLDSPIRNKPLRSQSTQTKITVRKASGITLFILALIVLVSYGVPRMFPDEKVVPSTSTDIEDSIDPSAGISMNGASSYGQIVGFDMPLPNSVLIEASFTASQGAGPASLAIWTGDRILGLYTDQENRWGVSFADGDSSIIYTSDEVAIIDKQQLIAARYHSGEVALFIDGREVPTTRRLYAMDARETTFCFGGIPDGLLPLDYGTRFIAGKLHRLRVSTGELPAPSSSILELVNQSESTIALIQFSETVGKYALDESDLNRNVELHDMPSTSR